MDVEGRAETDGDQVYTSTGNDPDPYQLKLELKPHLEALSQQSPEKPLRSPFKVIPNKPVKKSPFKRIKLKRARNTIHSINRKPHQDKQVVKNLMDDLSEIELSPDDPQSVDSDRKSLSNSGVAKIRNFHVEIERLK